MKRRGANARDPERSTSTIDLDSWNGILSVNLTGAPLRAQAVAPMMRQRAAAA
jgi:hypothetical protein